MCSPTNRVVKSVLVAAWILSLGIVVDAAAARPPAVHTQLDGHSAICSASQGATLIADTPESTDHGDDDGSDLDDDDGSDVACTDAIAAPFYADPRPAFCEHRDRHHGRAQWLASAARGPPYR